MINKKELVKAAKELNKIIQPDVPIATTAKTDDEVIKAGILEAASLLVEDDEVSEETQQVIDALFEEQDEDEDTGSQDEDEDTGSQDEVPEDEEDSPENEDEDDEQSTEELVTEASFKELLQLAENYPEFEKIDTKGLKSKDAEKLRKKMLKALAPKEEAPAKEEKKADKKKDAPKEEKKTAKKSDKAKGPGVIATIASCIADSGKKGVTKDEILKVLVMAFPERDATSMSKTINVQVPNRISKEKFEVTSKDGKYFKK